MFDKKRLVKGITLSWLTTKNPKKNNLFFNTKVDRFEIKKIKVQNLVRNLKYDMISMINVLIGNNLNADYKLHTRL